MPYKDKEKERQNKKEYYQKNKEKINRRTQLYGKKWYQKNKKRIQLLHRRWYQKNKERRAQYAEEWRKKNKEKILQQHKDYYQKNRLKILMSQKRYYNKNKEKRLRYKGEWQKYQRKINPKYRLDENMGSSIARTLKDKKAGQKWEDLLDYTLEELMRHLEKQFDNKMNWENYGNYWVVDHKKPKSLFNYTSPDDLEFKHCWALKNL